MPRIRDLLFVLFISLLFQSHARKEATQDSEKVVDDGSVDPISDFTLDEIFEEDFYFAPNADPDDAFPVLNDVGEAGSEAPCVDIPPPWSSHDCGFQAEHNKCNRDWIQGYCLKSCGKCDDKKGELSDHDNPVIINCPQSCNNNPPSFSLLSCETQKTLGKCGRPWMRGSCECTCGTCKDLQVILQEERSSRKSNTTDKQRPKRTEESTKRKSKDGNLRFTILHFNDFHSRVEEADNYFGECTPDESAAGKCHGGVARMKTVLDQERKAAAKRGEKVLLLNPGDDFAGTKWDQHYKGKAVAHFLNQLDIDAMALGNHEFDYGPDVLAHYLQSLNYSIVCANIKPNGHWIGSLVQPYVIKEIDGRKIGICGTTTQVTMQWSKPWPVQFDDSTWKTTECVESLKAQGINIIIVLSHEGLNADRYLGRKVPGIDLIIGGHSHSFLYSGETPPPAVSHFNGETVREVSWDSYPAVVDSWVETERKVLILQAGWASRYIGRFSVEFDEEGEIVDYSGWPILLGGRSSDHPVSENQKWKKEVASWRWW